MKKIKWGIIGSGKIARRFASDLKLLSDAELVGIVSRNPKNTQKFSAEFDTSAFTTINELLSSDVDVIYVATPHSSHHEHSLLAITAGKAVLCEKPFAMNFTEALEILTLAKSKNIFVMEAMWTRFFPAIQESLNLVKAGRIGKIQKIESSFGYKSSFDPSSRIYDPALGGGSLLDVGVYTVALIRMFLNEAPLKIESAATLSSTGVDESARWEMTFASGVIATGESSVVSLLQNEARIIGTEGELRIPRFWHPESFYLKEERRNFTYASMGFQFEAEEVMNGLRHGMTESIRWSQQDTLAVAKLMDDIRNSWT